MALTPGPEQTIKHCVAEITLRRDLLSLHDNTLLAVFAAGLLSAAFVVLARIGLMHVGARAPLTGLLLILFALFGLRWWRFRHDDSDSAFEMDRALGLEDRLVTAHQIIAGGGPRSAIEQALTEDAAARIRDFSANSVARYRLKPSHGTAALVSVLVLLAAFLVPLPSPPGKADAELAKADIKSAGDQLQSASEEIERLAPVTTETARLAREQAELGKTLRASPGVRLDALKKLSAIEERIKRRRDALKSTKADEIVSLADRRLAAAVSESAGNGAVPSKRNSAAEADAATSPSPDAKDRRGALQAERDSRSRRDRTRDAVRGSIAREPATLQPNRNQNAAAQTGESRANASGKNSNGRASETNSREAQVANGREASDKSANQSPKSASADATQNGRVAEEQRRDSNPSGSASDAIAEQAKRASGKISEKLLEKALEMKEGKLTERDIQRLAQAARVLSDDLKRMEESKELREALEQMSRQIKPEQIEQVARELAKNENLKQELQAAARLLSENQKAKDLVAGLAEKTKELREQLRAKGEPDSTERTTRREARLNARGANENGEDSRGAKAGNSSSGTGLARDEIRAAFEGKGSEARQAGKVGIGSGGQYLYLRSEASRSAARVPYASAYPQYRREAERRVQRSQVPAAMRSLVRDYFDAINPDQRK